MAGLSDIYTPSEIMAMMFPETSAYRPDLPRPMRGMDRSMFGQRHDIASGAKGYGWLGPMQAQSGGPMTEYSATNPAGRDFPQVTPMLTAEEMQYLLTEPRGLPNIPTRARSIDDSVYRKAKGWSNLRGLQGLSPFID
jgi:hypothetical protein